MDKSIMWIAVSILPVGFSPDNGRKTILEILVHHFIAKT
jgi:hypothetical protein